MSLSSPHPVARDLLRRAQHVLLVVLVLVGAVRSLSDGVRSLPVLTGTAAVLAWYVVGMLLARRVPRRWIGLGWLVVLTAGWIGLIVLSENFVWVVFPLVLLFLEMTATRIAVPAVMVLTAGSILAVALHRGRWEAAAVIGPTIGTAVAVVITVVYQRLRREAEERSRLLATLATAQEQLAATERRAGVLDERARLARELHDTVAQSVTSILLLLRAVDRTPDPLPDPVRRQVRAAMDAAGAALAQTRSMVQVEGGEGPEGASDAGEPLTEALHRLLGTADQLGLVTSLTVDGDTVHLPNAIAVPLLRIAQEALSNVVVHAGARRVAMTLTFQPDTVTLDVVDDGRGFDPADPTPSATAGTGLGLSAMRSRIEELGGTLTVETRRRGTGTGAGAAENPPGSSGTAIGATLPLGRANAAGSAGPLSTAPPAPVDNEPADTEPADTGPPWTVPAGGHR